MRSLRFVLALGVATLLHVAGVALFPQFSLAVDFFLVIVVFNAMDGNSVAGICLLYTSPSPRDHG
mgnify:CR=1 FL=1